MRGGMFERAARGVPPENARRRVFPPSPSDDFSSLARARPGTAAEKSGATHAGQGDGVGASDAEHADRARWHAIKRAWRRFGVALGLPDLLALERQIWTGKARWITDLEGSRAGHHLRQAYGVELRGVERIAIFDVRLGCIVTLLTSERHIIPQGGA